MVFSLYSVLCVLPVRQESSDDGSPSAGRMQQKRNIQIIEWEDLDKRKFYSFGVFMTMTIRVTVYPATLIRTRLQVQKGKSLYGGTFDAFFKILRSEGVRGLYRGFMVNTFTLISGQAYITTYELVRKYVSQYSEDNTVKSLVAGGSASLVAQSITVPIDVVSQQLMMQGQGQHLSRFRLKGSTETVKSKKVFGQTRNIMAQIFAADGLRGFYRGYVASLLTYIPNSAVWWPFYHFYAGQWSCAGFQCICFSEEDRRIRQFLFTFSRANHEFQVRSQIKEAASVKYQALSTLLRTMIVNDFNCECFNNMILILLSLFILLRISVSGFIHLACVALESARL